MKKVLLVIFFLSMVCIGCGKASDAIIKKNDNAVPEFSMKILSSVFQHQGIIPSKYTCDGDDVNPPLQIADVPDSVKSLVLIVDDPDAPAGTWVHWLVWDIDPQTIEIIENSLPIEAIEGTTSFQKPGYGGPCPPKGVHRYFFKLYALDKKLGLASDVESDDLVNAMAGHIVAEAVLIGKYERN